MNRQTHTAARRSEAPAGPRRGFTLIELLVVISIIGVLAGLLLPAINGAVRAAKESAVASEITLMEQALASFKTRMGDYPPSFLVLDESLAFDTSSGSSLMTFVKKHFSDRGVPSQLLESQASKAIQRSQRYLQKLFPRVNQANIQELAAKYDVSLPFGADWNGDGLIRNNVFILEGHEALVFFLGGIADTDDSDGTVKLMGFNKNPVFPTGYVNPIVLMNPKAANPNGYKNKNGQLMQPQPQLLNSRDNPFFEFKTDRLQVMSPYAKDASYKFTFPSYLDSFTSDDVSPYVYFSAYGSNSYDPHDSNIINSTTFDDDLQQPYSRVFSGGTLLSIAPNPYSTGPAAPSGRSPAWQKPQSYQIISSGSDRKFGFGGKFAGKTKSEPLPEETGSSSTSRQVESDNITNFSQGRLN